MKHRAIISRFLSSERRVAGPEVRAANNIHQGNKAYSERHENALRQVASPEGLLSAEALEYEFRAEIASVLGRVDKQLQEKLDALNTASEQVDQVLARQVRDVSALMEAVDKFNLAQQEAYDARLDLICQRQCAGLWVGNYQRILNRYPIPPKKRVRECSHQH